MNRKQREQTQHGGTLTIIATAFLSVLGLEWAGMAEGGISPLITGVSMFAVMALSLWTGVAECKQSGPLFWEERPGLYLAMVGIYGLVGTVLVTIGVWA